MIVLRAGMMQELVGASALGTCARRGGLHSFFGLSLCENVWERRDRVIRSRNDVHPALVPALVRVLPESTVDGPFILVKGESSSSSNDVFRTF